MGGSDSQPNGLDLTQGIPAARLEEGKPVAGQVNGEAVFVVRQGDEVFALSGTCTHYSGPLAEGLIVEGQVRCPWHHACFSLRTGDVIGAPALNPVARWRVDKRGGDLFVTEKFPERDPLEPRATAKTQVRSVLIVGGGAAGNSAAESLRAYGFTGSITIVDGDPDAPYDRPNLSKDYLAGTAPEEWLPLRPADFHAQHGIRRIVDEAKTINLPDKRVQLARGDDISFDALVLALGARPIRPPIPGADLSHVHVLRTLRDCRSLIAALKPGARVTIIGASFIGLEAAAALRQRDVQVTVVAPETVPFSRVLGPDIGAALMKLHQRHGVAFRLGRKLASVTERAVVLDDQSSIESDVVLLGIGVKPEVGLAEQAGIAVDGGILVNEFLETNAPGVYAAGDGARYPDARTGQRVRIEHWVVAQRQGQTVARNILGQRVPFRSVPFFWTQHYDTAVSYVGHAESYTEIKLDGSPEAGDCGASFLDGSKLLAYASIGRDQNSLKNERELELWAS